MMRFLSADGELDSALNKHVEAASSRSGSMQGLGITVG